MLGTLPQNKKSSWRDTVPTLVHAYNCSSQSVFGTQNADMNATTSTKFVQKLWERLKWAYKTAQYVIEKENQRHKGNYGHKIR